MSLPKQAPGLLCSTLPASISPVRMFACPTIPTCFHSCQTFCSDDHLILSPPLLLSVFTLAFSRLCGALGLSSDGVYGTRGDSKISHSTF